MRTFSENHFRSAQSLHIQSAWSVHLQTFCTLFNVEPRVCIKSILYYHCNVGLEVRPICDVGLSAQTPLSSSPSCRRPVPLQEVRLQTASRPKITRPCPSSSPPTRTDCSTSSSCACWRTFTRAQASGCMMPPPLHVIRSRCWVAHVWL